MKKKILILLSVLLLIVMAGCGNKEAGESTDGNQEGTQSEEEEVVVSTGDSTPALSVANDQFTFDELVLQIDVTEASLAGFLGAAETSEAYSTKLFDQDVTINVKAEDKIVQSLELVFEDVDPDSVKIAIGEQLGQDMEEVKGNMQWTFEGNTIVLTKNDTGCIVTIQK